MSDLTDLELKSAIASVVGCHYDGSGLVMAYGNWIDPLIDTMRANAWCHDLMIEFDVNIDRYHDSAFILSEYTDRPHKSNVSFAIDMNVNRAILLAIVEVHKS